MQAPLLDLAEKLTRELYQTENSARLHCEVEAKRLEDAAPSRAMREVSDHAAAVLKALPELTRKYKLPVSDGGMAVGKLFSTLRDGVADWLLDAERSYRGTLLGMRHGVDVVRLYREVAVGARFDDLVIFCDEWLRTREPLVETATANLVWFARNPERALTVPQGNKIARFFHSGAAGKA